VRQAGEDAQRELEQHALRNVRGLVDRMENDQEAMRASQRKFIGVIGIALVIAVLALLVVVNRGASSKPRSVEIPPPKAGQLMPEAPRAPQ
jgi:hypothetical protein